MAFYEISIPVDHTEKDLLIYELDQLGFTGFVEKEDGLLAYIEQADYNVKSFREVINSFSKPGIESITFKTIENQNWNSIWEASFQPQVIADKVLVKAPFHEVLTAYPYEVWIEPQMAFGTGHHATTSLMVKLQLKLDFKDKLVFDFGTGTGLLAIMAEKMGAKAIYANDIQAEAIRNCRLNLQHNDSKKITLSDQDFPDFPPFEAYDVILANITRNTIISRISDLYRFTKEQGFLVVSGFLKEDEDVVKNAINENGFNTIEILKQEKWVAGIFRKI